MHFLSTLLFAITASAAVLNPSPGIKDLNPFTKTHTMVSDPIVCGAVLNTHDNEDPTNDWTVTSLSHEDECHKLDFPTESYWYKNGCTCAIYTTADCTGEPVVHAEGPKQAPVEDVHSYSCYATPGGRFDVKET